MSNPRTLDPEQLAAESERWLAPEGLSAPDAAQSVYRGKIVPTP